ncbi:MAG: hypothetical protein A3I11_02180 [Elusimicrobia bacterium RIFCSPLOWO2_02_FULL_39_32]|nr:MAG: hypothetical protein A3B80_07065 [Elusimicrobia bacterium RIFCSPHIGHO2_02_FULL_39_36]OGR92186.1 MAG: hypothetical protein A3I11_02180 [Elusimicrobia bacterium RIFCSPLOWO2_02_FULL_39_32]OGR99946.1 MAG: hypothetical protein A3G85_03255 [Elusimicrobia bacterium RIFCSPLOWO2_12_FULL_39_28]
MKQGIRVYLYLFIIISFHLLISSWRFSFSPFGSHVDGFWYHKIARNFAEGKGFVESSVLYFNPEPSSIVHPVSAMWNPLSYVLLGNSYKILGISTLTARIPALIFDGIIAVLIFWFCVKIYQDLEISLLSSLIFSTHKFVLASRSIGGAPESFHLFFVTLFCLSLGIAWTKSSFFYYSSFFAGLAYLTRNESLWSILVIILIFMLKRRASEIDTEKPSWRILALSITVFLLVMMPWEIRNWIVYGSQANQAKYSLLFAREYYDIWSSGKNPEGLWWFIQEYFALGFKQIFIQKFQSLYYKLDTCMQFLTWPLVLFLFVGIAKNFKEKKYWPAYAYFSITYISMGLLNSLGQGGGWHAPGALLAFIIPIVVSGCYYFGELVAQRKRTVKIIGLLLSIFIFLYHLGDNYKQYRILQKNNFKIGSESYSLEIEKYLRSSTKNNKNLTPQQDNLTVMTHQPVILNFYTNIPAVQIPTNDSLEEVMRVAKKYHCNYLILTGILPSIFAKLYMEQEKIEGLKLVFEKTIPNIGIEGSGDRIKIYKIEL